MLTASLANVPYLNRFRSLVYVLVLLAMGSFAYAEPNFPLFVVAAVAAALSWVMVEGSRPITVPRLLINLGVVGVSVGLFYELVIVPEGGDIRQANLLQALGHFMGGILLCKLFERKNNRDYAQILTLTLLIMIAGSIIATASLFFAFLLAVYLGIGLYTVLLFHLRGETERALDEKLSTVEGPASGDAAIRKDIRLVALASAMLLLSIATVVFLVLPRSSGRNFLPWGGSNMSTGFSEQVRMQDYVNLHQSEAVVMEVKLEQDGVNLGPDLFSPYFRGLALDTYDVQNRKWLRSSGRMFGSTAEYPLGSGPLILKTPDLYIPSGTIVQTYTLRSGATNILFAIGPPVAFASEQLRSVGFSNRDDTLSTRGTVARPLNYTVTSAVIVKPTMFSDSPSIKPGDLGRTRMPGDDQYTYNTVPPEITSLARGLVPELLPPEGQAIQPEKIRPIAERFERYLRDTYPYSMQFKSVDANIDPTVDFLLNRKKIGGHCEFFASAMVMMCRSVGINAHMATGYHGGEYNSLGGFWVVKDKDAHAWVEVFVPERGWMIYDPSPAASGTSAAMAVTRWFQEVSQLAQKAWLSTVVAFDNTSRMYIFSSVSAFVETAGESVKQAATNCMMRIEELFGPSSTWTLRAVGLAAVGMIVWMFTWLGRRLQRRRTSQLPFILKTVDRKVQKQLAHDLIFFDDLLRVLARRVRRKRLQETPREYVEELSPALGAAAKDARWLIGTFYDIRFGTVRVNLTMQDRIDLALERVRQELQRGQSDRQL